MGKLARRSEYEGMLQRVGTVREDPLTVGSRRGALVEALGPTGDDKHRLGPFHAVLHPSVAWAAEKILS